MRGNTASDDDVPSTIDDVEDELQDAEPVNLCYGAENQ